MLKGLSSTDFDKFLATLDEDRNQAAEKYIALRERLERFFEWRGMENAEELTDIVFDRATKKIIEGEDVKNGEAFCVSVAKFVLLEGRRESFKTTDLEENSKEVSSLTKDNEDNIDEAKSKQLKCLDKCLKKLPEEKRKLIVGYFDTDEETMIGTRKRLAEKIGINLNSLRIRVSRLKTKVEKCTKKCCGES